MNFGFDFSLKVKNVDCKGAKDKKKIKLSDFQKFVLQCYYSDYIDTIHKV